MSVSLLVFNIIAFVAACVVCVLALKNFFKEKKSSSPLNKKESIMSERTRYIIIAIAAACALFVRIYKFGSIPGGMNQDGAMAAVDAKALADYGTDRFGMRFPIHLTAWKFGQMSALLSYMMAAFIKLFGFSTIVIRLPILIMSLLGLVFFTLLVKDIFGKDAATIAFVIAAINPWHIMQSRWALDCNLLPQFFIIGAYFLNKGINGKKINLAVSMVMFGLCMYCYGVAIYVVTFFLFVFCLYLLITKQLKFRYALMSLAVYAAVAWPFITCMAINYFKLDTIETPLFTIPYFPESVRSDDILIFSDNIIKQLFFNAGFLYKVFSMSLDDLPWNEIPGFKAIPFFLLSFAAVGLFNIFKSYRKNSGAILVVAMFLAGVFCGIMTNYINTNRVNIIFYSVIILCALGIYFVFSNLKLSKIIIPIFCTISFVWFSCIYFTTYAKEVSNAFYEDFTKAVQSIKDTSAKKIYITNDIPVSVNHDKITSILTQFYHQTDCLYYQGITKDEYGLTFSERYTFDDIKDIEINPDEDAIYVVSKAELEYFNQSIFSFTDYGDYLVVEKAE